jgi:iron complex outermembrane recepter protein
MTVWPNVAARSRIAAAFPGGFGTSTMSLAGTTGWASSKARFSTPNSIASMHRQKPVISMARDWPNDWRAFQASGLVCVGTPAVCVISLTNVGDARIDGLEAELNWQPVDGLVLHLGANELNSRVKNGPYMGKRVANAPNLTLDANVRYELPHLANGLRPYLQVSDSYQSTEFFENNNFPLQTEPGYSLVNLRAGIMSGSEGQGSRRTWDVAAWVHNLTDKIYRTESFDSGSFISSQNYYGPPRTYGVSLNYHY